MRKSFKYRLYPSKKQISIFNQTLNNCRWLYNHLLEQRKNAWEQNKKSISCFEQCNTFKLLKQEKPNLKIVYSQVLQNVAIRIDFAFKAFFRRTKVGEKPGYPRFRGKFRYDSFTYPQKGFKIIEEKNIIQLSKIGKIKIVYHRQIRGNIKTCTIRKTRTNKWFIIFSCEIKNTLPIKISIKNKVGIDMGLESFATLSNNKKIETPHFFRKEEKTLAKAQRKFSKQEKRTNKRKKLGKIVCHIHERISNKRHNFIHQLSHNLVKNFDFIAIENLSINNMKKNNFHNINKSIGDAAWRMFLDNISYKAAWAGKKCIKVNPAYTSQTCSQCGHRHKLKLSERIFKCPYCHLSLNRDYNASLNILTLGMQSLALA